MPGLNGTGPHGMGPMTGRGMGYCIIPISTREKELEYLRNRSEAMVEELRQIEIRISKLEKVAATSSQEVVG
jgi:hypothetical protein